MSIQNFTIIIKYLKAHPKVLSLRGETHSLESPVTIAKLKERYDKALASRIYPKAITTHPDPVVSLVMQIVHGYTPKVTDPLKILHQESMQAENIVGSLLERYLDQSLQNNGWVWCAGDFVRAVDFIKPIGEGWKALQIKNRDNSENSSSSAIREGTTIDKWFRTFSRTGATNWAAFPDTEARPHLSEEGFHQFVKTHLMAVKSTLQQQ